MGRKLLQYSLVLLGLVILVGFGLKYFNQQNLGAGDLKIEDLKSEELLKVDKSKVLGDITLGTGTVEYVFASNIKVASTTYKGKNEDLSKRTFNTQVYPLDKKDGKDVYEFKIYVGAAFYKDGADWLEVEYATTTKEAFDLQMKPDIVDEVSYFLRRTFLPYQKALAQTNYAVHTSDDRIYGNSNNWATCRALSSGVAASGNAIITPVQAEDIGGPDYYISRGFFNFDTSAIDDSYTISAATFYLYPQGVGATNETTNPANPRLVGNTSASDTALANGDFDQVGTTLYSDATPTVANFKDAGAYYGWALNSTGIAAVSKTGYTKLSIRAANDFDDAHTPTARSYANAYASEQTGTSNDPYLSVTAAAGGGSTPVKIPDIIIFD